MALNKVEYHVQSGAFFTFKVQAGQTVKIGEIVEIVGDRTVKTAVADSQAPVGVVYSGTVGVDGVTTGYQGNNGDVVTVIVLKPIVYLTAGATVAAGNQLKTGANGTAVPATVATDLYNERVGIAITGAASGSKFLALLV